MTCKFFSNFGAVKPKYVVYDWSLSNAYTSKIFAPWSLSWVSGSSGPLRSECIGNSQTLWYDLILLATGSSAYNQLQTGGKFTR